jgi:hypothetical protein
MGWGKRRISSFVRVCLLTIGEAVEASHWEGNIEICSRDREILLALCCTWRR